MALPSTPSLVKPVATTSVESNGDMSPTSSDANSGAVAGLLSKEVVEGMSAQALPVVRHTGSVESRESSMDAARLQGGNPAITPVRLDR